jgi:putative membrane protein
MRVDTEDAMWEFWPWPFMFFGPLMMVLLIIAICAAIMFFMRGTGHRARSGYALEILKERFARGEITQAEYEERRRVLEA